VPGAAAPGITAAGHVTMTAGLWRPAAVAGALAIVAAGVLVCWRGTRWPVMSGRYQRPGQAGRGPATDGPATDGPATDGAALWDALSGGADPTEPAGERPPPRGPG
jgi:uncharacterized membrane protein (TIGR02234 family)